MSEAEGLLDRCRAGDQAAWAQLVGTYERYVHAICVHGYRLAGDDAADVFQEAFACVWRGLEHIPDEDALRSCLGQVTSRLCAQRPGSAAPDGRIAEIELAMDVRAALEEFPERCRELVDRYVCLAQPPARISEELGVPAATVAVRVARCLVQLRARLER